MLNTALQEVTQIQVGSSKMKAFKTIGSPLIGDYSTIILEPPCLRNTQLALLPVGQR